MTKIYTFEVSKGGSEYEEVSIIANSREEAEEELRVFGIIFCGGITFKLSKQSPIT